jgi:hypothetical protein
LADITSCIFFFIEEILFTKNSHKKKSGFVKVLRQEERVMKAEYAPYIVQMLKLEQRGETGQITNNMLAFAANINPGRVRSLQEMRASFVNRRQKQGKVKIHSVAEDENASGLKVKRCKMVSILCRYCQASNWSIF